MEYTRKDLKEAILYFAEKYGKEKGYRAMLNNSMGFPKAVELIVYDIFLHGGHGDMCDDVWYHSILLAYARELSQRGYVVFS